MWGETVKPYYERDGKGQFIPGRKQVKTPTHRAAILCSRSPRWPLFRSSRALWDRPIPTEPFRPAHAAIATPSPHKRRGDTPTLRCLRDRLHLVGHDAVAAEVVRTFVAEAINDGQVDHVLVASEARQPKRTRCVVIHGGLKPGLVIARREKRVALGCREQDGTKTVPVAAVDRLEGFSVAALETEGLCVHVNPLSLVTIPLAVQIVKG